MANARKKGKKKVAFWLTEAEISLLKEMQGEIGLNMTDVFRTILIKEAKKRGALQNAKSKK